MVCLGRPYYFKFFKGSFPQILLGPFLNTLNHLYHALLPIYFAWNSRLYTTISFRIIMNNVFFSFQHWSLFNSSIIPNLGFTHSVYFKPHRFAPMYNNYAFCQTKTYLPSDFNLVNGATVLLSLYHKIPSHAMWESMRKYKQRMDEVNMGEIFSTFLCICSYYILYLLHAI